MREVAVKAVARLKMTPEERTADMMRRIKQILVYEAPELLESRLARFCIDEMAALVEDGDLWLLRWLRHRASTDAAREALWLDIAALVVSGEHWKWIQAEVLKKETS
jgi:hypothetical protein